MAERRMMSKKIIHSDAFLDLPATTQNLYFHLMLEGDDEGFVNSPKRIQRTIGATDGDAQMLIAKKFIIAFESGIVVIKHWRIHNYIQKDRFKESSHIEERSKLAIKDNNAYTLDDVSNLDTNCTPRIGEDRIGEVSIVEDRDIVEQSSTTFKEIDILNNTNLNTEAFFEWKAHKKMKAKATITKCINFLSKYPKDIQQEIVNVSIMNGWKGLFPPKINQQQKTFKQLDSERVDKSIDAYLDAVDNGFNFREHLARGSETIDGEIIDAIE